MKKVPILCGKEGDFHQARWYSLDKWIPTHEQIDLFSSNILSSLLAMHINLMGDFPGGWVVKYLPANAEAGEDVRLIPGLGISHGGRNGNSLQYYCLESSMDTEAWQSWVTKSDWMQWIINHIPKQGTFSKCLIQVHMLYWGMYIYTMQNMN